MKVKRFFASDMRQAIQQVREALGADAVILSNRSVPNGVEILAAVDYDAELINQALQETEKEKPKAPPARTSPPSVKTADSGAWASPSPPQAQPASAFSYPTWQNEKPGQSSQPSTQTSEKQHKAPSKPNPWAEWGDENPPEVAEESPSESVNKGLGSQFDFAAFAKGASHNSTSWPSSTDELKDVRDELRSLRNLMENQFALLDWNRQGQSNPLRVGLLKRLNTLGLSPDICRGLADQVDTRLELEEASNQALRILTEQIPVMDDEILDKGGVIAMVGPTGVGKTTTIAKLAARYTMRHGHRHVALVTTDSYRIGAQEQLLTYGRIIGVPVHTASTPEELQRVLQGLSNKKLVLIDTAGMGQRDTRLFEQFNLLNCGQVKPRCYLVLSAHAQMPTLDEAVRTFKRANLAGCILTKVDETASLGSAMSIVIRHRLPLAYISNGQRVPEDLQLARAQALVAQALELMKSQREQPDMDDDFLAFAFSEGVVHAR